MVGKARMRGVPTQKRKTASQRCVTFTKRRQGLFSKAAQLCQLSGAQIVILVTAPSNRNNYYVFGHPSVDDLIDRFLLATTSSTSSTSSTSLASTSSASTSSSSSSDQTKTLTLTPTGKKRKRDEIGLDDRCCWDDGSDLDLTIEERIQRMEKLKDHALKRMRSAVLETKKPQSPLENQNPNQNVLADHLALAAETQVDHDHYLDLDLDLGFDLDFVFADSQTSHQETVDGLGNNSRGIEGQGPEPYMAFLEKEIDALPDDGYAIGNSFSDPMGAMIDEIDCGYNNVTMAGRYD